MKGAACFLAVVLLAGVAAADLVTLKNGSKTTGTVVSVNASVVVVKSEVGRQKFKRDAVRSIEFGDAVVTGIVDQTFTSKELRARFVAPEGWAMYKEPGVDFAAKRGNWIALARLLPLAGLQDGGVSLIGGAVAGMTSNLPDSTTGEPQPCTWAGQKATRVDITSPQIYLAAYFLHMPDNVVMFAVGAPTAEYSAETVDAALDAWEQGFALIPD